MKAMIRRGGQGNKKDRDCLSVFLKYARKELNLRHLVPKTSALSAELRALI